MNEFLGQWYGILTFALVDALALLVIVCLTYRWFFKRVFDVLVSAVCLLVLSPLFLTVFLKGTAAKKRGETEKLVQSDEYVCKKGRVKDLHLFAIPEGKYGEWLKRTKLYAILRLWDVFCGRMSIVGATPFTESDCEGLTDVQMDRFLAKPGLIDPLYKREQAEKEEALLSDQKYAWQYAFFLDCKIFFSWLLHKIRGE
ncbi:MAG: sugar transferase [Clostridia bacterium]|nr:sugar transferase [Clostridia bacterium]